jgi:hypothetical protein
MTSQYLHHAPVIRNALDRATRRERLVEAGDEESSRITVHKVSDAWLEFISRDQIDAVLSVFGLVSRWCEDDTPLDSHSVPEFRNSFNSIV